MIKFLVMDVDGTLTDGKIYMGAEGELTKAFDIKDGAGIVLTLPKYDIIPVIITARESKILENRCKELNISEFYQNSKNKMETLKGALEKYDADLSSVAYAGDDLPDIPCMEAVKTAGGLVLVPANAIPEIRALADYISDFKAGDGAIRDCINYLVDYNKEEKDRAIKDRVKKTIEQILSSDYSNLDAGEHELQDGTKYNLQVYNTKDEKDCVLESHRTHIDIQYMVEGAERFKMYTTACLSSAGEYNKDKDCDFWKSGLEATESLLVPGSLIVVYNYQPHKGAIKIGEHSEIVKKVVCKIEL